jgi:hypothetical protein
MAEIWPYPPSDMVDVKSGSLRTGPDRLLGYKSSWSLQYSVQCPDKSTTGIIYSSLSNEPQQSKSQPVSPAHRLAATSDSGQSFSLCLVWADYQLARQFPPELFIIGTELEQRSQYRSQISYQYLISIDLGLAVQDKGNFSKQLSFSIFYFKNYYIHTSLVVHVDVAVYVLWTF